MEYRSIAKVFDLKITLSNTLKVVNVPEPLYSDLQERLQLANPQWVEDERMGRWNRGVPKKLTFYQKFGVQGLVLPRGFMRQLLVLARQHNIALTLDDQRRLLASHDFAFHGQLKAFQKIAVDRMLSKDFGTLCAPTGSGKTIMALKLVAERQQPTLVVVHTKDLALQWMDRIESFLGIPKPQIGLIGGGSKTIGSVISVALVQSLYKCGTEIAPKIGHLIVDECHRAPSRTFTEAIHPFDARFMLGLSATPYRRDKLSNLIFWHLGDMHHQVSASALVSQGDILDVEVVIRPTEFKPYYDPVLEYSKMLTELTVDDHRNRLIVADVSDEVQNQQRPGVCLVLSDRKRHCQMLATLLRHRHHLEADILTGDLSLTQRTQIVAKLKTGQTKVVIATGQLIGEGFDCDALSTLFLATPVRFSGRVLQYLGRVLRPTPGILQAKVYDYVDVHVGPLKAAAHSRMKVYRLR